MILGSLDREEGSPGQLALQCHATWRKSMNNPRLGGGEAKAQANSQKSAFHLNQFPLPWKCLPPGLCDVLPARAFSDARPGSC